MNLEKLKTKLVDTCLHLKATKDRKKAITAAMGEEVKGSERRIDAISEAIKTNSCEPLIDIFDEDEIDELRT